MEFNKTYQLTNESVDEISEHIAQFLSENKTEPKNILRFRLLSEEFLLDWQEHFSSEAVCQLKMGKHFGHSYLTLELPGESFNPLVKDIENFGEYRSRLLANMGLAPLYSYDRGRNRITFKLKKPPFNPLASLGIAVVSALLVGLGGMYLPAIIRDVLLNNVLTPIYDTFFDLLGTIAGPMVFLSVAWGIYGIGDTATFGRIGKRMIGNFLGSSFLLAAISTALALPFFSLHYAIGGGSFSQVDSLFQMILDFIPPDMVSPFLNGNSMQIITMAIAVGLALLILGKQTEYVAQTIEQINYIIQLLMELISKLVPSFIFIVLVQMIWSGTFTSVLSAWKPVVVFVVIGLLVSAALLLLAALSGGASPKLVLKKSLPTFIIATTTASSVASFGHCVSTCENKLGVNNSVTSFGTPLGIVMFPPGTAIYFLLICIHAAETYGVQCSVAWFVLAIFTATILAIASPPIPGGTLTCYTIMFSQLGLPEEALVVALALDVLFDFLATGLNMFCLQLNLVIQAKKMGLLDVSILRRQT